MRSIALLLCACMTIAGGCSKPATAENDDLPRWDIVLQQGNVLSTSLTFERPASGSVVCRYDIVGEDAVREYPVPGNTVLFTTVTLHDRLVVVHGADPLSRDSVAQMTIALPSGTEAMRSAGPAYVNPTRDEQTIWTQTWHAEDGTELAGVKVSIVVK